MALVAIEINDAGLTAAGPAGPVGASSPGFALLDRRELVCGEAARSVSRLRPRFVSHRHWHRLDIAPVGRPFPRGLSHADLVHAHLTQYWRELLAALDLPVARISVLLAVPGSYSPEQLGLLLGIARACDMPVTGLVDSGLADAVAAGAGSSPAGAVALHLDLQLHRAVWTVVETGERWRRAEVESVEGAGLLRFQDACARLIAERFVRQTRFDPLHKGATEQALYERIPALVRELEATDSVVVELESGGRERSVEISAAQLGATAGAERDAIAAAATPLLAASAVEGLVLTSRSASVPGLASSLAELTGIQPLVSRAGAGAALHHRDLIESPGQVLPLVLELPALHPLAESSRG